MILVKKMEISSMFPFWTEYETISANHLVRKQAFQDHKNIDFTRLSY